MSPAKPTKEDKIHQAQERVYAGLVEDVERTRRYIEREGLCSVMNDTKWSELVSAMRSLGGFAPRYRQKHVRSETPANWDGEWFYHLIPH